MSDGFTKPFTKAEMEAIRRATQDEAGIRRDFRAKLKRVGRQLPFSEDLRRHRASRRRDHRQAPREGTRGPRGRLIGRAGTSSAAALRADPAHANRNGPLCDQASDCVTPFS